MVSETPENRNSLPSISFASATKLSCRPKERNTQKENTEAEAYLGYDEHQECYIHVNSQGEESLRVRDRNERNETDLQNIIIAALPSLIKLLLATQLTDKIEAITEIAELFNITESVQKVLTTIPLETV